MVARHREVARRDIGDAIVRPAVRVAKMAIAEAELLRRLVHPLDERFLGARNTLGQDDTRIVARQDHHAVQQVLDRNLLARRQEHGRARGRAMPLAPGFRANLEFLIQLQVAALDHVEDDIGRHHLRHRGGWHPAIGVLGKEHGARRQILHEGDGRDGLELRRSGNGGIGDRQCDCGHGQVGH